MKAKILRATLPLMLTGLPLAAVAAEAGSPSPGSQVAAAPLEEVTVTATRSEKLVIEAPATVSVIDAREIEDNLVTDIKDLIRYEPGVSVRNAPARFSAAGASTGRDGNSGFTIRGLEGNRVLIQVDGIRTPDGFSFGPQATGRGDLTDLDLIKSVEILRGPASALYGSDGVAGAVSFVTKDPGDYLKNGDTVHGEGRVGYAGADSSWNLGALTAARSGRWEMMLAYSRRDGEEQKTQGTNDSATVNRTKANPQEITSDSLLGKLVFTANEAHRFRLTVDYLERAVDTDVLSGRSATVANLTAEDDTRRARISLDHLYSAGALLLDDLHWTAYHQTGKIQQFSAEDRTTAADRTRDSLFENKVTGLSVEANSQTLGKEIAHRLSYGGDVSLTRQTGLRDGVTPPVGETFPIKAFPDTDYILGGLYLQDEITALDGALSLYPAVRLDYYRLDPDENDPLFPYESAEASDWHVSPKIGGVYWVTPSVGLFANYARGYKAPSPSQVNNGFENVTFNYRSEPNPDLKPETSETIEGGLRFRREGWAASATGFAGWYDDFIDQIQVGGSLTPSDPAVFQYVNLNEVKITGAEAKVQYQSESGFGGIVTAAYARGTVKEDGVKSALDSIDPVKLVAGLTYHDPQDRFGGQLSVTRSAGKAQSRTSCGSDCPAGSVPFTPGPFTVVDLTGYWTVSDMVTLRAGLFNLFDETYWWWSDVRGLTASSSFIDAYSQPGRNASVSLTVRF